MKQPYAEPILHISYWDLFQKYYSPMLREVDLIIKTMTNPLTIAEAARVLRLTENKINQIMTQKDIKLIDKEGFLNIMLHGDSSLCGLLQREYMRGSPNLYCPEDIAYIYNLMHERVSDVCRAAGFADKIPTRAIPDILSKIPVYIMKLDD